MYIETYSFPQRTQRANADFEHLKTFLLSFAHSHSVVIPWFLPDSLTCPEMTTLAFPGLLSSDPLLFVQNISALILQFHSASTSGKKQNRGKPQEGQRLWTKTSPMRKRHLSLLLSNNSESAGNSVWSLCLLEADVHGSACGGRRRDRKDVAISL